MKKLKKTRKKWIETKKKLNESKFALAQYSTNSKEHLDVMWKEIYEWATQLLVLSKETERNRIEIREVREEVERLTLIVQGLAFEIKRLSEKIDHAHENETHEREKFALKIENEMLKFERRLPSAKDKE